MVLVLMPTDNIKRHTLILWRPLKVLCSLAKKTREISS